MSRLTPNDAALAMRAGQVVAYPTEAVWGLGCDPFNQAAVQRILDLKQRPVEKGVILIAASLAQVERYLVGLTAEQYQRVVDSWQPNQGANTWLVPLTAEIPAWISGEHDRVAIRVSQHPLVQALCLAYGGAIVSTSANPAGAEPARTAEQIQDYFADQVPCVSGEVGQLARPSVIRDAITGQVLRA